MTLTFQQVEEWLDSHVQYAEEYFLRKASSQLVVKWYEKRGKRVCILDDSERKASKDTLAKSKSLSFKDTVDIIDDEEKSSLTGDPLDVIETRIESSAATRPAITRRYSEPYPPPPGMNTRRNERRHHSLQEHSRYNDVQPQSVSYFEALVDYSINSQEDKVRNPQRQLRKAKSLPNCGQQQILGSLIESKLKLPNSKTLDKAMKLDLKKSDEKSFFFEIVKDIANDLDLKTLSYKILVNVGILTNADRCSLFLVEGTRAKRMLVSKVFDVHITSPSAHGIDFMDQQKEIRVPWGKGLVGYAAEYGETVNIGDVYSDPRFNQEIDKQTGYRTKSLLCKPIKNNEGDVVGVAQIINKNPGGIAFTKEDEEVCDMYLTFCGIGITNAKLFELSVQEFNRNRALLELVHDIFEEQTSLNKVVNKIMRKAVSMLKCERCSVLILMEPVAGNNTARERLAEDLKFSKVFNLRATGFKKNVNSDKEEMSPILRKISRFVSSTGKTLNISDINKDPRFTLSKTGGSDHIHSVLCMPVRNNKFEIIGCALLINKLETPSFDENDENLFEAFVLFCGLGIHNTMMYDQMSRAKAKQQVALEVLSYHATSRPKEVDELIKKVNAIPKEGDLELSSFVFNDFSLEGDEMLVASLRMFQRCSFIEEFNIDMRTLCRWLLTVRKNYRNVTYHNWRHAFNVAQSMYAMQTSGGLNAMLSSVECLGLLVGCLCHDLDHRGTNNAFQAKSDSPLAKLYGTSTMEHHHFNHAVIILSTDGHNIFQNMSPDDYRAVIRHMRHSILSTDLALNFKYRPTFFPLVEKNELDLNCNEHRDMLKAMLMTACDLNGITKPWDIQREVVNLVTSEFFEQGDLERTRLKMEPVALMDRKKKDELPKMQVQFFDSTGIPVFKALSKISVNLKVLLEGASKNRNRWHELSDEMEKEKPVSGPRVEDTQSVVKEAIKDKNEQAVLAS